MPVRSILVTGASGPLADRVRERLGAEATALLGDGSVDLEGAALGGYDTIVDLGRTTGPPRSALPADAVDPGVTATERLLGAAVKAAVRSLVHVSSAVVYGAWSDNAIPLTEEAALRPNPAVAEAAREAETERVIADWADAHPDVRVCVLRTATPLGPGVDSWLARAVGGRASLRPSDLDPPRQFVHVDDLADAVALAARGDLSGVYNVAADGWIGGEEVRVLGPGGPTLALPRRVAGALSAWAWHLHLSRLPPEVSPLIEQPWVVANDRLRAAGWTPSYTNEEAVVAGTSGSWWREMSPNRRQEVALAGSGAAIAGIVAGVVALARRRR